MICVGTSSCLSRWELQRCTRNIHHRRRGRSCGKYYQDQEYRNVHSSLEVAARPPPNWPHNYLHTLSWQKIETTGRFCTFTPPLGFRPRTQRRKWDIIDIVAEDTVSESRRSRTVTGNPPCASSLRQGSSKKLTFALSAGRQYEFRKLPSVREVSTSIRAERISKERRSGRSPDYQRDTELEEDNGEGLAGDTSIWDSNAEGIRRSRSKKRSRTQSEMPLRDRSQKQKQVSDYDDAEVTSRIPRNWTPEKKQQWEFDDAEPGTRNRFQEEEWDYDAEASNKNRTARRRKSQEESSRWWQSNEDSGSYEYERETGEASTIFQDLFSWINTDIKDAFLFIRWGLPAAVLLVPWLMGNPMMLLLGLSFIPAANKLIFPIASQIFRTVMSGGSPPKPKRKRKQSTASSSSSRRSQAQRTSTFYERGAPTASTSTSSSDPEADKFSSVETTIFGDPNDAVLPRKPLRLAGRSNETGSARKRLGGWEDLEEDRARARSERWPAERRSSRSEKKIVKREQNIFIKLILILFPFLRYWGGLM